MTQLDELERLRPTEGARFLLQLEKVEQEGRQARYQAWVLTPSRVHTYGALLADDASIAVSAVEVPAPDELQKMLSNIAFLTARAAAGKRADGLPPWPHRVLRWRGPGR
ncbi:MAG TPA: hypothetical protein VHE35_25220 [Kofleriaceae bacterium]|nr:hypothetical protein [Kofleriaceae bacterium]